MLRIIRNDSIENSAVLKSRNLENYHLELHLTHIVKNANVFKIQFFEHVCEISKTKLLSSRPKSCMRSVIKSYAQKISGECMPIYPAEVFNA